MRPNGGGCVAGGGVGDDAEVVEKERASLREV